VLGRDELHQRGEGLGEDPLDVPSALHAVVEEGEDRTGRVEEPALLGP
jgi:hypothetical protein